jgi:APA family basic amino acid/polyamine antiporter
MTDRDASPPPQQKPLGFWSCWSLAVGCMIGSGILLLPAVLAPYGLLSFGGWLISAAGSIALALTFARLASRTTHSGGPYVFTRKAYGDLTGYLMGWGHWVSQWTAIPPIAIAFTGYLAALVPGLAENHLAQAGVSLALIWTLTFIQIMGLREANFVQIATTVLKVAPILLIAAAGFAFGRVETLPPAHPQGGSVFAALAACALLTLWPFTGFEAGTTPAGSVADAERVIPRAVVSATLVVAALYLAASFAVMLLVPSAQLAQSTAPFADAAARAFGPWAGPAVAVAALVVAAGTLNGIIFVCGQIPLAVAQDGLAPRWLAATDAGGSPHVALILSSALGTVLLALSYTRGAVDAFAFLVMMSTISLLAPYLGCAIAEARHSWKSARAWAIVALFGAAFSVFAILGSGLEVAAWGVLLLAAGLPVYFLGRAKRVVAAT